MNAELPKTLETADVMAALDHWLRGMTGLRAAIKRELGIATEEEIRTLNRMLENIGGKNAG